MCYHMYYDIALFDYASEKTAMLQECTELSTVQNCRIDDCKIAELTTASSPVIQMSI